jgi:hypothetical protein
VTGDDDNDDDVTKNFDLTCTHRTGEPIVSVYHKTVSRTAPDVLTSRLLMWVNYEHVELIYLTVN